MALFFISMNAVAPVFLIIMLGWALKRWKHINDAYIATSSRLIFHFALPALVFIKIANTDFRALWDGKLILFILATTCLFITIIWLGASLVISQREDRAVFVQGSFRSNIAIVGLAVIASGFNDKTLSLGTVMLAFLMPLYNITSVLILSSAHHQEERRPGKILKRLATNPLIIAALVSLCVSFWRIPIPAVLNKTATILGAVALPLALINIGAGLQVQGSRQENTVAAMASVIKIALIPALATLAAHALGYGGDELAALFIIFASPTAVASYIMARGMDCNHRLAGTIVTYSTLASMITLAVGIFLLKSIGWI